MRSEVALSAESRAAAMALVASVTAFAASVGVGPDTRDPIDAAPSPEAGHVFAADSSRGAGSSDEATSDSGAGPVFVEDPLREVADTCLDGMAELARLEAGFAALKVRLAAEYLAAAEALTPPVSAPQERTAHQLAMVAELACVLTVSERSADALMSQALALTTALPLTLAALQSGQISWQHARIMVDETVNLERAGAAALEAHFLAPYFPGLDVPDPARGCPAGDLVPGRFRAKARTWRERHHPVSIETRHTNSARERRVEFVPDCDGMAWLNTYLPADTAAGIWERTTAAARSLQGPAEGRNLAQLRADVAAALLLTGTTSPGTTTSGTSGASGADLSGAGLTGNVPSPRAQVLVMVPVLSLLGVTEEPAMLDGYGPIPPSMARRLVAGGTDSLYRVLVDPRDGAALEIGRNSYRPTEALRRWLRLRDGKCSFPGCNNPSLDNETDHLLAWADGGTTGISNLGQACRKHHGLKHATAWTPSGATKDHPPGWKSPSGRTYQSEYQDWEPPHLPDTVLAQDFPSADPLFDSEPHLDLEPGQGPGTGPDPGPGPLPDGEPDFESGPPPDPGPDADLSLPEDPSPNWHLYTGFTAA